MKVLGTKVSWHAIFAVVVLLSLSVVGCSRQRMNDLPDDGMARVRLSFSAEQADVRLRGILSDEAERRVNHVRLFVFDASGNAEFSDVYEADSVGVLRGKLHPVADPGAPGAPDNSISYPDTTTTSRGNFHTIELQSGAKKIVVIANSKKSAGASFDIKGTNDFDHITTYDALKSLVAEMTAESFDYLRSGGSIMMVGEVDADLVSGQTNNIQVPLVRTDAQVTFQIYTEKGEGVESISFEPNEWGVRHIPLSFYLMPRQRPADALTNTVNLTGDWDAAISAEQFVDIEPKQFDFVSQADANKGIIANGAFYMPENRKLPKAQITQKDNEGFYLRGKQKKTDAGSWLENGAYEYAPDLATTLTFSGNLAIKYTDGTSRHAKVSYNIPLGYSKDDLINDYDIERNVFYTYRIYIKDADKIRLEAISSKEQEDERNPQIEGTVIDAKQDFILDAHYEQFYFTLKQGDLGVYEAGTNTLKPNAELAIWVETPFTGHIVEITYTPDELRELAAALTWDKSDRVMLDKRKALSPELKKKVSDTEWLRFALSNTKKVRRGVTPRDYQDPNDDKTMRYYTEAYNAASMGEGKLMTLAEMLNLVVNNPTAAFADGEAKFTCFVGEYFYEREPTDALINGSASPRCNDLWHKFANAQPRTFELFGFADQKSQHISPDTKSLFRTPLVYVEQHSIKTIFVEDPTPADVDADPTKRFHVWGVDNFINTPNQMPHYAGDGTLAMRYTTRNTAGWLNTWRAMDADKPTIDSWAETKRLNLAIGIRKFSTNTTVKNAELALSKVNISEGGTEQIFAPFLANRDDNANDEFDNRELKWYVPAIAQLQMYGMFLNVLPEIARINISPNNYKEAYPSSTSFADAAPGNMKMLLAATRVTDITSYDYRESFVNADRTNPENFPGTILVRDLGFIESNEDPTAGSDRVDRKKFPIVARGERLEINVMMQPEVQFFSADSTFSYYFSANHIKDNGLRSQVINGELQDHNILSTQNKIYKGGFTVARKLAADLYAIDPKTNKSVALSSNKVDQWSRKLYYRPWLLIKADLTKGMSACSRYYEREDKSDMGTWRMPNAAELAVMMNQIPRSNWEYLVRPRPGRYGLSDNPWYGSIVMFWSRTSLSTSVLKNNIPQGSWAPEDQGIGVRHSDVGGTIDKFSTLSATGLGKWDIYTNKNRQGYVRCVRDGKHLNQ